jgi:hypothetical protein
MKEMFNALVQCPDCIGGNEEKISHLHEEEGGKEITSA